MVTGGGSIGSELCRQIAAHDPKELVIFDVYENNAYDIQQELKKKYPNLKLDVIIGSVQDSRKIFKVFETYHPEIVYHAAAHKHVPLMEDSPARPSRTTPSVPTRPRTRGSPWLQEVRSHQYGQGGQSHQHHGSFQTPL